MRVWRGRADLYLAELLRLEAPLTEDMICPSWDGSGCQGVAEYRCLACLDQTMFCQACLVAGHRRLPLHRVQVPGLVSPSRILTLMDLSKHWNGEFFERTTMHDLGLRIQLGHFPGDECSNPYPADPKFTIIDVDGIHLVHLDYCNCHCVEARDIQLLRRRLYPASPVTPETCCTFRVLEVFQLKSFMSKVSSLPSRSTQHNRHAKQISAYEYYFTLSRLTDNLGTQTPPVRVSIKPKGYNFICVDVHRIDISFFSAWFDNGDTSN